MKLTWLSNAPWTSTGYGQQTALFTTRLAKAGHPVAIIANYGHQGAVMNWNGVQVFGNSFHPFALDVMSGCTQTFGADAVLTLMDLQVFDPSMLRGVKWISWFPLDHHTMPPLLLHNVKQADVVIAMSKHGSAELNAAGVEHEYIPCAYDGQVFKPLDMAESRTTMKLPLDKFIVGMVAMNKGAPSRKAFQANIAAFAALKKKHGDCVMYIHTADGTRGENLENLPEFCHAVGLSFGYSGYNEDGKDVIFANQFGYGAMGYEMGMMAKLYSSMDVLTAVTRGEGFGLPIIEAQACGTPVIVGDWTSMPELCFSGWKVNREETEAILTPLNAWHYQPRAGAIAKRMEASYQMRGNPDYRKRAKAGVQQYEADRVFNNHWLPSIERIETKLKESRPQSLERNLEVLR